MWVTWPPPKPPPHCMSKKHFGKWLWKDQKPRVVYQNCYDSWGWHDFSIIFYPPPWSPRFLPLFSTLNGQLVSLPTGWKQWNHGGDQLQLWDLHSSSRLSLKNGPKPSGKRAETNHPIVQGLFFFFVSGRVLIHTLISYYMILLKKQLSSSQEILKTKQFAVFTQSLQYLFFWFEEVFTQRFFSVKHQLSRMNSSGASDLITRRIQGWVEAEMLKMTWYYPYHPCMVYLPTFGWCLC